MKFSLSTLLLGTGLALSLGACKKDDDKVTTPVGQEIQIPAGNIATTTWTANNKYIINGFVYVPNGATLTIEPGTIIKGDKASKGSLIVQRGGKLIANGTVDKPIVFTSNVAKGARAPGDWGGVIICGKAPVNLTGGSGTVEGGPDATYGGTDPADNSGSLRYVRIEFAGIALTPNNEINSLTLAAVGSGTVIDHVQTSFGGDDAFEFFGGTVNAKYLIATHTTDDMFDTDNGFSGKVQFALGVADPNISDQAGASNGFESDNDANASTSTPQTSAQFANITLVGPQATTGATIPAGGSKFGQAAHLRRNTAQSLYNVVLAGWPKGLTIDGSLTEANYSSGLLKTQGVVISGVPTEKTFGTSSTSTFNVGQYYNATLNMNAVMADNAALQLNANAFSQTATIAVPAAGSPLLDAAKAAPLPTGFEAAPFRGAFGTTNWTTGWANFDPQNTDY